MHNWKSPPSRFRGPSPPLLGIHSQSFTWPACTTTGHPLPAIYVAPQAPAPPLLGIQPSRLRGPSAATGYPLPAISAARPHFYCMWVSTPSHLRGPLLPLLGIQPSHCRCWVSTPSHLRGPAGPGSATTGYPTQPFTWPICRYWVSTPSHPRPVSATTGYPLPAIYVAHRGGPPLLGIHPPPFTWPVSGPPLLVTIPILYIAGYHSHRPFSTPRRPTCCACTTKAYPSRCGRQ